MQILFRKINKQRMNNFNLKITISVNNSPYIRTPKQYNLAQFPPKVPQVSKEISK